MHADDVGAVAAIQLYCEDAGVPTPETIRTRNEYEFIGCVVDVGEGQFDHHGKAAGVDADGIPFSGFSRVFLHLCQKLEQFGIDPITRRALEIFKKRVSDPVSKLDNGQTLEKGEYSLLSFVAQFNPGYGDDEDMDERFAEAVAVAKPILRQAWNRALATAKAEKVVEAAVEEANKGKFVIELPKGLNDVWPRALAETKALFVIFQVRDTWYIQCVPESVENLFTPKVLLPAKWAGKRGTELDGVTCFSDSVFCHINRFIAGFKSKESAELAAIIAMVDDAAATLLDE
jgi:uncharacterized UPF0160 family protein